MQASLVRLLTRLVWGIVIGCVVGALAGWIVAQTLHLPQVDALDSFQPASSTQLYGDDDSPVASFALERRVVLRPEEIPDQLKLAIVAIEDADFYRHGGIDPQAILRATFYSLTEGRLGARGGASTLTQQLALNLFLERERTLTRKLKEALLAIDIEKRFSKDQILTMYANQIFFGHGAYGVEAAARLYFGLAASQLDLAQCALLAGMIPSPNNRYDPIRRPEAALARRDRVLDRMVELGFINTGQRDQAKAEPIGVSLHRDRATTGAYFIEMVRQDIDSRYGADALYKGGLEVRLTMDPPLQQAAEEAVRNGLVELEQRLGWRDPPNVVTDGRAADAASWSDPTWRQLELAPGGMVHAVVTEVGNDRARLRIDQRTAVLSLAGAAWTKTNSLKRLLTPGDLVLVRLPDPLPEDPSAELEVSLLQEPAVEGALLAMDSRTGAILAVVGGFDFARSEFNRAVQSRLQCGSAFKPFVWLTAFQQGFTPADTLFDAPFLLPDATGELTYCPRNYYPKYYGIVTLREALEDSYNATAVKLQQLVGGDAVVDTAKRLGISTPLHPYASLALGSLEVKLIDLVRAYAGIANLGELPQPYFIREVTDAEGRLRERNFPHVEKVMPSAPTYLMLHVMRGVVERGTARSARHLDAHLAGKTGTTDNHTDAWFIGFSPRITVGVWVGHNLKEPIGRGMTGAEAALPIWSHFMESYLNRLTDAQRAEDFPVPAGVVFAAVDARTGKRAIPSCNPVVLEAFLDGTEPADSCSDEEHRIIELPWPFQEPYYTPRPGEPMPTPEAIAAADERLNPKPDDADAH